MSAVHALVSKITQQEDINFLLTNRLPRRLITRFMGWFSKIDNPVVSKLSIAVWKFFSPDLDLSEARESHFRSMHDCFIRQLKPGVRAIDKSDEAIVSPCDAIVGMHGRVVDGQLYQIKGFPYQLDELLQDQSLIDRYRNGQYLTLRLTSTMYHRFHAPYKCKVHKVNYISGDTWNVNPIALKRVENLFCKNERVVIDLDIHDSQFHMTLVPVAAILVASIRLHCLDMPLDLRYKGANYIACDAEFSKGDEIGYFQHGSTIIVFTDERVELSDQVFYGETIRMGRPLFVKKG